MAGLGRYEHGFDGAIDPAESRDTNRYPECDGRVPGPLELRLGDQDARERSRDAGG